MKRLVIGTLLALLVLSMPLTSSFALETPPVYEAGELTIDLPGEPATAPAESEKPGGPVSAPKKLQTVTISFAGDCTLGQDIASRHGNTFSSVYQRVGSADYFFKRVAPIFSQDDLTVVNLETTLTMAKEPKPIKPVLSKSGISRGEAVGTKETERSFRFKGLPQYRDILKKGSVEVVNLANNHSRDYMARGNADTKRYLKGVGIAYAEEYETAVKTVKGVKVGFLGFRGFDTSLGTLNKVQTGVKSLRAGGCNIVVVVFHWGEREQVYQPDQIQKTLAKTAVAAGADLVVGSHAHVLQGIDAYKGRTIVYGLGNFCFGGNVRPKDFDTMIYQHTFNLEDGEIASENGRVIPCAISSTKPLNNFQPMPLTGVERERVLKKIVSLSPTRSHVLSRAGEVLFK